MNDNNPQKKTVDANHLPPENNNIPRGGMPQRNFPQRADYPPPPDFPPQQFPPQNNLPETPEEGSGIGAPMLIAIILAAIAVLGAAGFFGYLFFFRDKGEEETTQPSTAVSQTAGDTRAETSPPATEGKTAAIVTMPDLTGMSESDAYKTLNETGVKYKVTRQYSEDVAINNVITQKPDPGESISTSSQATIYISKGPENTVYPTPTVPSSTGEPDSEPPTTTKPRRRSDTSGTDDDYLLPDSDSAYVSRADLAGFDRETLNLSLNEIFARHGRKFNDPSISAYFNSKSWYRGTVSPADFDASVLNAYEAYNVNLISEYQAEKGYR